MVVRDYLLHECSQGRIIGPLDNSLRPFLQINRFGVIPKKNSNRWRLILDLSAPEGKSVNDVYIPTATKLAIAMREARVFNSLNHSICFLVVQTVILFDSFF